MPFAYNHGRSPGNCDASEKVPWPKLSKNNSGRWLKDHIRNEEDENNDVVSLTDEFQIDSHSIEFVSSGPIPSEVWRKPTPQYWQHSGWSCPSNWPCKGDPKPRQDDDRLDE